jgi:hypothetical protein
MNCWLGVVAVSLIASSLRADLPAFPGAEGFGAAATGGRGGEGVQVTGTFRTVYWL